MIYALEYLLNCSVILVYQSSSPCGPLSLYFHRVAGFRCLHSTSNRCNEKWLLHGKLLPSNKDQVWQRNDRWASWYVWTNAWWVTAKRQKLHYKTRCINTVILCIRVLMPFNGHVFDRKWHRHRSRSHSGPLFSYHGTSSHKPTLQWPRCKWQRFTPASVWHRKQTIHKNKPGKTLV